MKNTMFAPGELKKIVQESAEKVNKKYELEIKSLTSIPEDTIKAICPKEEDKEKLVELLDGLKRATTLEDKKEHIVKNVGEFGEILVNIIGKFLI